MQAISKLVWTVIVAAAMFSALNAPALSDTTKAWTGTVTYINSRHIGVKAHAQTRDFLLDSSTAYVINGKTASRNNISVGQNVTVTYEQSAFFGSTKATRITVTTFNFPMPGATTQ